MYLKNILIIISLFISLAGAVAQENKVDANGMKQGSWIKNYPNGNKQYEGTFKDNHPVGEFKRFFEDGQLQSVMLFDDSGLSAMALFYHPDGKKAAEGKYVGKKREGLWKFYSAITDGYLVSEENYLSDIRHGLSRKFYNNGEVAETLNYLNGTKHGAWSQYYIDGKPCLKATYNDGHLQGEFLFYYPDGTVQVEGTYQADLRTGRWKIYNSDGSIKSEIEYINGKPTDSSLDEKETKLLDDLEKNKGKIADPEMAGNE